MRSITVAAACAAVSILGVPGAFAEDHDHAAPLGDVTFPISCTPEAQKRFNAAAALLYSFQRERIDNALADVLVADPDCPMA